MVCVRLAAKESYEKFLLFITVDTIRSCGTTTKVFTSNFV